MSILKQMYNKNVDSKMKKPYLILFYNSIKSGTNTSTNCARITLQPGKLIDEL